MKKSIKFAASLLLILSLALCFASCGMNQQKITAVETLIANLSDVSLESKSDVEAARSAYNELGSALQEQVSNAQVLFDAEDKIELLEKVTVTDFESISCNKANKFDDTSYDTWFYDDDATAMLLITFLLEGDSKGWYSINELSPFDTIIGRNKADERYDLLVPDKDNGIYYIQYWPEAQKAQMGTKKLSMDLSEYAEALQEAEIIDSSKGVSMDSYMKILNMMY